jgi:hypothetical protein
MHCQQLLPNYFANLLHNPKNFDIDNLCGPSKKKPPPNGLHFAPTQEREECNLWDGSQAAGRFTGHGVWH